MSFTVRFWGVRGSIACPTSNHIGFGGNTSCVEVACGGTRIRVVTASLNYPNGGTGYRIAYGGKVLCYVTDTEHEIDAADQNVLGLIEGADMVIYDCTYTDEEFPAKIGWGHSTWEEGIRLCRAANWRSFTTTPITKTRS